MSNLKSHWYYRRIDTTIAAMHYLILIVIKFFFFISRVLDLNLAQILLLTQISKTIFERERERDYVETKVWKYLENIPPNWADSKFRLILHRQLFLLKQMFAC